MLKTLGAQIKEFQAASIATPIFMTIEVLMETVIPFLMASIIDEGVERETCGISVLWAQAWRYWQCLGW